ncbi:MAG: hypothetical protein M1819_004726 [Sarea resinae]|nr:MAG: hypothetical protein M1819_004726 [Sarea resinae]
MNQDTNDLDEWLGHALRIFATFMLLGALMTHFWVPETRSSEGMRNSLQELGEGLHREHGEKLAASTSENPTLVLRRLNAVEASYSDPVSKSL